MLNRKSPLRDVMRSAQSIPVVKTKDMFRVALEVLNEKKLGIVCVCNDENKLVGVLTDGDVRRMVLYNQAPLPMLFVEPVERYMTPNPITVTGDMTLDEGLRFLNKKLVWAAPVVEASDALVGLFHMQFALRSYLG